MTVLVAPALLLSFAFIQGPSALPVRHYDVVSTHNSDVSDQYPPHILFEYAYRVFPEDHPVRAGAIDCYVSRLKSTGLFDNVRVELKPSEDRKWVDVYITVDWVLERRQFYLDEIDFDGFAGLDVPRIALSLRKQGLHEGISLFKYDPNEIRKMIYDDADDLYSSDEARRDSLIHLSVTFSYQVVRAGRVRMWISSLSRNPCQP